MDDEDGPQADEAERREWKRNANARRLLSLISEVTKATLAVLMVLTTCTIVFIGRIIEGANPDDTTVRMPSEWWAMLGLVVGFYFGQQGKNGIPPEKR